jgi:uncharacterized protein (TIGR02147 family)
MDFDSNIPSDWLNEEFKQLRSKNSAFSLRAFAKFLNMPASRLSEILSQKRLLTMTAAEKISKRLMWEPQLKNKFIECVANQISIKKNKITSVKPIGLTDDYHQISSDLFNAICDWEHYALLSLAETNNFKLNVPWIARRLGIDPSQIRIAICRLERLGLIKIKKGKIHKTYINLTTPDGVYAADHKKGSQLLLQKALDSLNHVKRQHRDVSSITMAIDPRKISEAKERIKNFRRELAAFLETDNKEEVYSLCIQLFPLSKFEDIT